jgi:hypothetical protein
VTLQRGQPSHENGAPVAVASTRQTASTSRNYVYLPIAAKAVEISAVAFGRTPATAITFENRDPENVVVFGRRGTVVNKTGGGNRRADPLLNDGYDFENSLAFRGVGLDTVANFYLRCWFCCLTVYLHVPTVAGISGVRTGRKHSHRPQPFVDPRGFHSNMMPVVCVELFASKRPRTALLGVTN